MSMDSIPPILLGLGLYKGFGCFRSAHSSPYRGEAEKRPQDKHAAILQGELFKLAQKVKSEQYDRELGQDGLRHLIDSCRRLSQEPG